MVRIFYEFHDKIFLRENIIVNITVYSVNIFFDTCLIREIKNMKIIFTNFSTVCLYVFVTKVFGASLSEPHINVKFVRSVCLSVYLSVSLSFCPHIHDTKYARVILIYGAPSVVDCSV